MSLVVRVRVRTHCLPKNHNAHYIRVIRAGIESDFRTMDIFEYRKLHVYHSDTFIALLFVCTSLTTQKSIPPPPTLKLN